MSKALVPIEQKTVIFYEDEITAVLVDAHGNEEVYVPIRPLCGYLGVNWSAQTRRIDRDPVLSEASMSVAITTTDIEEGSRRPHTSEMLCLPLDFINGWLFGINASRVKSEVREQLIRYQRECYRVLADAFIRTEESAVAAPNPILVQVREMGRAIMQMAQEQIEFEMRLTTAESRLEIVASFDERLTAVEQQLSPGDPVTQSQAMEISQAVKAVALALGKKTGRNEFGAVYGELYRRYEITSYKILPARKFGDAMAFLTEWHRALVNDSDDIPF